MKKLKTLFALLVLSFFTIGNVWATDIVIDLDLTKSSTYPNDFPTETGTKSGTYTFGGYDFDFSCNNAIYRTSSGSGANIKYAILIGKCSNTQQTASVITFPAIANYKLSEVVLTVGTGSGTNVKAFIGTAFNSQLTGGSDWTFNNSTTNNANVHTWSLSGTAANTAYKMFITRASGSNSYNGQIGGIKLTYVSTASDPTVSSISIKTAPTNLEYTEGDFFDPTGLVITANYSNSTSNDVAYANHESDFTFSPSLTTALTTSDASVRITYGGKYVDQAITVTGCTSSITIEKGTPTNGTFDMSGAGTVCIDGGNASVTISNIVPADGYRFKEITSSAASGGGTINNTTKTVTDISATTTINVVFEVIPTVTAVSNNNEYGTVATASGTTIGTTVITATPAEGYRVNDDNPYTVTVGTAAVSRGTGKNSNKFTVNPSEECTVRINFEAIPQYTVTWDNNGNKSVTTQVYEGSKPVFPATPSAFDAISTTFVGWSTAKWDGKLANLAEKTVYTSADAMPAVTGAITYYAVFAKLDITGSVTIANSDFTGELTASYATKTITKGDYSFEVNACKQNDMCQMRDNATVSYIAIPTLPGVITELSTTVCSAAGTDGYTGTLHLKSSKTRGNSDTDDIAKVSYSAADDFDWFISGNVSHSAGWLVTNAGLRLKDLTITYGEYSAFVTTSHAVTLDYEDVQTHGTVILQESGVDVSDGSMYSQGVEFNLDADPDPAETYKALVQIVKSENLEEDVTAAVYNAGTITMPNYAITIRVSFPEKAAAGLAWRIGEVVVDEATVTYGESSNIYPTLYNPHSLSTGITYSSLYEEVASFADASVYEITLNAVGETLITASFAGNEDYKSQEVSYLLTVTDKATGIEDVETSVKAVKVLRNGVLYIEKNGRTYNAQGLLIK